MEKLTGVAGFFPPPSFVDRLLFILYGVTTPLRPPSVAQTLEDPVRLPDRVAGDDHQDHEEDGHHPDPKAEVELSRRGHVCEGSPTHARRSRVAGSSRLEELCRADLLRLSQMRGR